MDRKTPLIVITGPTASGKSALAVAVAQALGTEIISADSRQIYRGIPIATAVPTEEERGGVVHHLLETLPLEAYYSAADFETDALALASDIMERTGSAVVCGGSMLYVDALCNGIDDLPTVPEELRFDLDRQWKEYGDRWLLSELERVDPIHFMRVDRRNLKRVFHALEVSMASGVPYSSLLTGKKRRLPFPVVKICLDGNRTELFGRINSRVEAMMETGLEEEARRVWPLRPLNSLNTVGLKEMFALFEGRMTRDEAVERMKKNTRVYAKKQMTWHKRGDSLFRLDFSDSVADNRDWILELVKSRGQSV